MGRRDTYGMKIRTNKTFCKYPGVKGAEGKELVAEELQSMLILLRKRFIVTGYIFEFESAKQTLAKIQKYWSKEF